MPDKAVKVAVRVRLFNGREKEMKAKLGVDMCTNDDDPNEPSATYIWPEEAYDDDGNPDYSKGVKKSFDYSLWSHSPAGCPVGPNGPRPYVTQTVLYENIGQRLFDDFWGPNGDGNGGFECCLFAYGQSGSGKSFSMTGANPRCAEEYKGMIPKFSAATFRQVDQLQDPDNRRLEVKCTMSEIYLDKVDVLGIA
jgi:kinesin family protein 13